MTRLMTLAAAAMVTFAGCNKSPEGGSAGTSNSFTISGPTMATTIKQKNTEPVKITLNRGKDFKQVVKLVATYPDKVKGTFTKDTIAPSDPAETTLNVTAEAGAAVGDQMIKVTATPEGGTATTLDVKIKVENNP